VLLQVLLSIHTIVCLCSFRLSTGERPLSTDIRWAICFWMILGGLAIHCIINLIARAIAKCVLQRKVWAIIVITFLRFLVPVGIAVYTAGTFTLVIIGNHLKFSKLSLWVSKVPSRTRGGGVVKILRKVGVPLFFKSLLHAWRKQGVADSPQVCSNQGISCIEMAE